MRNSYFIVPIFCFILSCSETSTEEHKKAFNAKTVFETSNGTETATYQQTINYYKALAKHYKSISIDSVGHTDAGKPLHIVTYHPNNATANFKSIRQTQRIVLINNGIHPGESDGIDASMMLFRDLANGTIKTPKQTTVVTIPIYNIGGSLHRNSTTRTNQNGPKSYGFRGNAQNYDLNRDFIKADTKNTKSFAKLFHTIQPDVFIDTHVSNGADYQYTLSHLFTQYNKLGGTLGTFLHQTIQPKLEKSLHTKDWDITPYVNVFNKPPEVGFSQFLDTPRYSTGYTSLFNTIGLMVETHMLKPYNKRVTGTYELLKSMITITDNNANAILKHRNAQLTHWQSGDHYPIAWQVDSTKHTILQFKGFKADTITSEITGFNRLKFDTNTPITIPVMFKNYYQPKTTVTIPKAYVIPQGWHSVVSLLKQNNITLNPIKNDTVITVESYKIANYNTKTSPYEGHYLHYNTTVKTSKLKKTFYAGDYIVSTAQPGLRYLLETLEPEATDSFFNWNFFDTILQQKEGFSPYVWEDKALQILKSNPKLQMEYNVKISYNDDFRANWYQQLDWIHKQSKHYESTHMQYPIYRLH